MSKATFPAATKLSVRLSPTPCPQRCPSVTGVMTLLKSHRSTNMAACRALYNRAPPRTWFPSSVASLLNGVVARVIDLLPSLLLSLILCFVGLASVPFICVIVLVFAIASIAMLVTTSPFILCFLVVILIFLLIVAILVLFEQALRLWPSSSASSASMPFPPTLKRAA